MHQDRIRGFDARYVLTSPAGRTNTRQRAIMLIARPGSNDARRPATESLFVSAVGLGRIGLTGGARRRFRTWPDKIR